MESHFPRSTPSLSPPRTWGTLAQGGGPSVHGLCALPVESSLPPAVRCWFFRGGHHKSLSHRCTGKPGRGAGRREEQACG